MTFPLPFPWIEGTPDAGLQDNPLDAIQQNLDAIATALGPIAGLPVAFLADQVNVRLYAARLNCFNPTPAIVAGLGVTGIARTAAGAYTITHDSAPGPFGYVLGVCVSQGNTAATARAHCAPNDRTTSFITVADAAGTALDGEVVTWIGIG